MAGRDGGARRKLWPAERGRRIFGAPIHPFITRIIIDRP
jgi:hypothetical protein